MPDITYAEGFTGVHALYHYFFFNAIRTAVIEPLTDKTPDGRPMQAETFLIDVGRKLGSPLWGENAIKGMGPNEGKTYPLMRAEDFHLKQIANLVHDLESKGYKIEPRKEDVEFVEKNYPIAKYKNAVSLEEWPKVAFLLSRGGFFISYQDHFDGNLYKFPLNKDGMVRFYFEGLATRHNPITGKYMSGHPRYVSIREAGAYQGFDPDKVEAEYPFKLITYKPALHTQSRTMNYIWAHESEPENRLWINPVDAQRLGIKDGDWVKVLAPGYDDWAVEINGKKIEYKIRAYVTNRIRQGVVAISCNFGHWCHTGQYKVPLKSADQVLLGLKKFKEFPEWRVRALHGSLKIADGDKILSDPKRDTGAPYIAIYPVAKLPTGVVYPFFYFFVRVMKSPSSSIEVPKVFKDVCLSCHSVKALNLKGGGRAPDISKILSKAKKYGGFEEYIKQKYKADPYEFFLYPSKFVPQMAIVEGRVYSKDVDELLIFFEKIPTEEGIDFPFLPLILFFFLLAVAFFKLRKKKRLVVP